MRGLTQTQTPPPQLYQDSVLHCSVPISVAALNPQLLYQQTLAVPQGVTLQCQLQPAPCGRQLLNCHLLEQQGDILILDLVRLGQYGTVGVGSILVQEMLCAWSLTLFIFPFLSDLPFPSLTVTLQALVTSRVAEPLAGDPVWRNRNLVAVLVQEPGHWLTYLHQNLLWWQVIRGKV